MASVASAFDLKSVTWDEDPGKQAIVDQVPLEPGTRVLDVGCGTGLGGMPLASRTGRLTGIDLSSGCGGRTAIR